MHFVSGVWHVWCGLEVLVQSEVMMDTSIAASLQFRALVDQLDASNRLEKRRVTMRAARQRQEAFSFWCVRYHNKAMLSATSPKSAAGCSQDEPNDKLWPAPQWRHEKAPREGRNNGKHSRKWSEKDEHTPENGQNKRKHSRNRDDTTENSPEERLKKEGNSPE